MDKSPYEKALLYEKKKQEKLFKHYLRLSSSSSPKLGNGKLWLTRPPLEIIH